MPIRMTFGLACRSIRLDLDLSLREVAGAAGITASYLARVEDGMVNPTLSVMERIASVVGLELELVVRPPVLIDPPGRTVDNVHARCSGFASRRLLALDWSVAREVEVVHGRRHGWIDLLAFHPRTGVLLIIEIKTRLDDIGAVERQMAWYERSAWSVAHGLGWKPRRTMSWLLALDSSEVEMVLRANRDVFGIAFPARARDLSMLLGGNETKASAGRGLALIDPRSRGCDWLRRSRIDGRRSPPAYEGYADAARAMAAASR